MPRFGINVQHSWIEHFLDSRLLEPYDVGTLSFAHNLLRETLLSERQSERDWRTVHSACARVLRQTDQPSRTQIAAHHLAAGEYLEAFSEQLKEADVQRYRSNYEQALRVLLDAFLTYKAGRKSGLKLRCVAEVRWRWAICARVLGRFLPAKRHATKTWFAGRSNADVALEARGRLEMGRCIEATVGARSALPIYQDAVAVARSGEPNQLLIHCVGALAKAYRTMSEFDKARQYYRESLALGRRYGTANDTGVILLGLARIELITGQLQAGKIIAEDALTIFQDVGSKWGLGQAHGLLGDAERLLGDLNLAEMSYREAAAQLHATRSIDAPYSDANLGIVLMELGRFAEASQAFEKAIEQVGQIGTQKAYLSIMAVSLCCDANLHAFSRFDTKIVELQALMTTTLADLDIAIFAHKCAEDLTLQGERDRAEFVWQLAIRQYEILGRPQTAEEIRAQWRAQIPVV